MGSGASIQVDAADMHEFNSLQGKNLRQTHDRQEATVGILNFGQKDARFVSESSLQGNYDSPHLTMLRVDGSKKADKAPGSCTLRIVAINDVYELENFPRFLTAKRVESVGPDLCIATLAGRCCLDNSNTDKSRIIFEFPIFDT